MDNAQKENKNDRRRNVIPELPFLKEEDHPETISIATPYIRAYHNAVTSQGINVAGSIGMFNGAFRELFFVLSHFEERINDLEEYCLKQKEIVDRLQEKLDNFKA
ncbi:hypothetical protein HCQ94_04080 [Actinomyces sp. zg-332]|uniref:hypothetical protein n=1 Tax=Actinomyces sp. zg-332 TaxID=2708340 RepID=UPI00141E44FC|nr:hypothetical protein [Actinomyces sp. zg-332]QPK93775.1 hypothetical protein HCQ94_04080 [Actinomyces sp. zg-332]